MGKRQEAAMATRQKIVEAMRALLREKPADRINIEEITERAGVAKGSFYTHFKRKEDVISVVAMDAYNAAKETAAGYSGSIAEKISSYLRDSAKIITGNTLQIAQNWMKSVAAPLSGEDGGIEKYRFDYGNILSLLQQAAENGELRPDTPAKTLTQSIMNSYYGAVISWCITRGEADLTAGIEDYCTRELPLLIEHAGRPQNTEGGE